MTYSCGIFKPETTLEEASLAKYDRIIDHLEIKPDHHLLEIRVWLGWIRPSFGGTHGYPSHRHHHFRTTVPVRPRTHSQERMG